MDLDVDKIIHSPFITGAFGAVVTAVRFTPGVTWFEKVVNVGLGALASGYITPALIEWLGVTSQAYFGCAAFLFGMLSMSLAAALLDGIKATKLGEIIESWLKRRG
jgi:hypothetical protein